MYPRSTQRAKRGSDASRRGSTSRLKAKRLASGTLFEDTMGKVPSLQELCIRFVSKHIDDVEEFGGE